MSLGRGAIYCSTSNKQKMVARSSTEAELIATHDVMPQVMWTQHFMKAQGHDVGMSTLYQDNKSAMLLEMNGRGSSGKRTRHINIRFFYIKDRVDSKGICIKHCPTEDMYGDYFTKATQGKLFLKQRNYIMNIDPSSKYYYMGHRSVLEREDSQVNKRTNDERVHVANSDQVKYDVVRNNHVSNETGSRSYLNVLMGGVIR